MGTGAATPHPARSTPARSARWKYFLIRYCDCEAGRTVGVAVAVGRSVGMAVGREVEVGSSVALLVAVGRASGVSVGNCGILVTPGTGVRVGRFGTQSLWPA